MEETDGEEDEILKEMGANYEQVLTFSWACHHTMEEVPYPLMSPLPDDETIAWENETRGLIAEAKSFALQVIDLNKDTPARRTDPQMPQVQGYASDAMTKLADSMVRYQEASLKNQEEKGDSRLKAWKKLPKIQQNIILFGGVTDQGDILEEEAISEMSPSWVAKTAPRWNNSCDSQWKATT